MAKPRIQKTNQTSQALVYTEYRVCKAYPSKGRKIFRIQGREKKWHTLKLEELDRINEGFVSGRTPYATAFNKCKDLLKTLYYERDKEKPIAVYHSENLRILEQYWNAVYTPKRQRRMVAPECAYGDLRRAVESLGNLPIDSTSENEMQEHLDGLYDSGMIDLNKHRRLCTWLNMILKWLNRPFTMEPLNKVRFDVMFMPESDLLKTLEFIARDDLRVLMRVAYYTGMRFGEIFATDPKFLKNGDELTVAFQVDRSHKLRDTKTGGVRDIYVSDKAKLALEEWFEISSEMKLKIRHLKVAKILRTAALKAFHPKSDEYKKYQKLHFHDLRHSYAINLLNGGLSLALVAQSLGNSNEVCERYYVGYRLTNESLDTIRRLFKTPK